MCQGLPFQYWLTQYHTPEIEITPRNKIGAAVFLRPSINAGISWSFPNGRENPKQPSERKTVPLLLQ
jgi:hypothetical protein